MERLIAATLQWPHTDKPGQPSSQIKSTCPRLPGLVDSLAWSAHHLQSAGSGRQRMPWHHTVLVVTLLACRCRPWQTSWLHCELFFWGGGL